MTGRLRDVETYAVYYGCGGEDVLATYDLAVVAAPGRSPGEISAIKRKGTLVLAYLSVLEIHPEEGPPAGVLVGRDGPVVNDQWGNWVLDPRHEATRDRALSEAEALLRQGYDGLFLDTLADLEDLPAAVGAGGQTAIVDAARLVAEVSDSFHCILVQNRGFRRLLPLTMSYLDGLCWESFPYHRVGLFPAMNRTVRSLKRMERSTGLRVLALNEWAGGGATKGDRRRAQATARLCGFPWYGTRLYTDRPSPASPVGVAGR